MDTAQRYKLDGQTNPGNVTALIQMHQVSKLFKVGGSDFAALKGVEASFYQGEFIAVVGKSGSGKSTLVNMITGIDRPTAGTVSVGEVTLSRMGESRMSLWRGRNLGIVFQFFQLLPMLSLLENVMLPMDFAGVVPPAEREPRALALLKRVGLEGLAHKLPGAVAGGQQQSAAIARALANDPPILIADEPTGNLDSTSARGIIDLFTELVSYGKTILIVTHDPEVAQRTSRMVLLCDGEVIHPLVAAAMPWLPHPQMLRLTHAMVERRLAPGEVLLHAGETAAALWLVAQGTLEMMGEPDNALPGFEEIFPGETAGGWSLFNGSPSPVNVQAGPDGAIVLGVDQAVMVSALAQAPAARPALEQFAQAQLANFSSQQIGSQA